MKISAGILLYRRTGHGLEVLLIHPGGPLWASKDLGAWSVPKGETVEGEPLLATAVREFGEETGFPLTGSPMALGQVRQRGGKVVHVWGVEGDADPGALRSNAFEMEWPRGSGEMRSFPEADRAQWFELGEARRRINPAQAAFLDALASWPWE